MTELMHPIAKMIVEKGIDSIDLSMFSDEQKKQIFSQAADNLLRLNRYEEALFALERAGRELPLDQLKKNAEEKMMLGQHKEACNLFAKAGHKDMADFIKSNFL